MDNRNRGSYPRAGLRGGTYTTDAMPVENTSFRPSASSDLYDTSLFGQVSRYGSHRRRSSHVYADMAPSEQLPVAPEVPWGAESYQMQSQRYVNLPRRSSNSRRSHIYEDQQPLQPQSDVMISPQQFEQTIIPVSPTAQEDTNDVLKPEKMISSKRKNSVPEQSPLQRLEGKLGTISKEERRAKVMEAETKFGEKSASHNFKRNELVELDLAPNIGRSDRLQRNGYATKLVPNPQELMTDEELYYVEAKASSAKGKRRRSDGVDSAVNRAIGVSSIQSGSSESRQITSPEVDVQSETIHNQHNESSRAIGLGLYDGPTPDLDPNRAQPRSTVTTAQTHLDQKQAHPAKARQPARSMSSSRRPTEATPRSVVGDSRLNDERKPSLNKRHTIYEQSDSNKRTGSPFGDYHTTSRLTRNPTESFLGTRQQSLNRTGPMKLLNEWSSASRAALVAEDFNLVQPDTASNRNVAWWEQKDFQRWKTASQPGSTRQTGFKEDNLRQTSFNPPLFLHCGPLLRYTGIRKTKAGQELWSGSVMIVTDDNKSSYKDTPVLRLFSQPMTPIPAPPTEIERQRGQSLPAEYIDPVEGETKSSRSGKTLYVRPVNHLDEYVDLSRVEDDNGLFEEVPSTSRALKAKKLRVSVMDGEKANKYRQVRGIRLLTERGVTFWRFSISVELIAQQSRVAFRINNGPAIGFWVPAKGSSMNIMFHSCNGFSVSVNPDEFSGPDPLWRDVLNSHQFKPFHVMIGAGDQIYMDAVVQKTKHFRKWMHIKDTAYKQSLPFTSEMENELEEFYLRRYCTWFSSGLFGLANAQIPMVNLWDDHDILDGFGSYSHYSMCSPVFMGLGSVAFKYYMLFQHQSVRQETQKEEPSWLLGASPGPYIKERSRSMFLSLGGNIAFLGLDCRTERMRDQIFSPQTYDLIFERLRNEIVIAKTRHLIVMLGVPIAYPRLNMLENMFSSRAFEPVKALGRAGVMGNFLNKLDGGVEVLDDLDDHWTAKHHKQERNWLIQELQEIASEKSVRITILGGDVHLAAVGQFYSNKKLGIPKDRDHRYMPNVISSAITNAPPLDLMADIINQRNKIHHLDPETDEDMIPMFLEDVDGKPRKNKHLLPRRNWCAIREYIPGSTPLPTPTTDGSASHEEMPRPDLLTRTSSLTRQDLRPANLVRRLSRGAAPPVSFRGVGSGAPERSGIARRHSTTDAEAGRSDGSYFPDQRRNSTDVTALPSPVKRPVSFLRRPTELSQKALRGGSVDFNQGNVSEQSNWDGHINLESGLEVIINAEVVKGDPAGVTSPYKLLVPALSCHGTQDIPLAPKPSRVNTLLRGLSVRGIKRQNTAPASYVLTNEWNNDGTQSQASSAVEENFPPNGSGNYINQYSNDKVARVRDKTEDRAAINNSRDRVNNRSVSFREDLKIRNSPENGYNSDFKNAEFRNEPKREKVGCIDENYSDDSYHDDSSDHDGSTQKTRFRREGQGPIRTIPSATPAPVAGNRGNSYRRHTQIASAAVNMVKNDTYRRGQSTDEEDDLDDRYEDGDDAVGDYRSKNDDAEASYFDDEILPPEGKNRYGPNRKLKELEAQMRPEYGEKTRRRSWKFWE